MTVTHTQHQADYDAGFNAAREDILALGKEEAARKWRMENPSDAQPSSLAAYYYAKAGLDALVAA